MKYVRVLDLFMPVEWAISIVVQIFKGTGDIWNFICYGAVNLLEHDMKVVKMVFEKRLCRIVSVYEM